jgi:hypothetical protein
MSHFALLCRARVFRNVPIPRCSRYQHRACSSSGFSHQFPHPPDTVAARSNLRTAEGGVSVLGIGRNPFGFDFVPVHIEFFGYQHGHRGHDALSHFELGEQDRDAVISADFQPDARLECAGRLDGKHGSKPGNRASDQEGSTGGTDFQKGAAI